MSNFQKAYLVLFFLAIASGVHALDCLDSSGHSIAWWAKIKLPGNLHTAAHLYYDARDDSAKSQNFKAFSKSVDDAGTALYRTLDQLNSIPRSSVKILAFNDEFPSGKTFSGRAHAKGVVAYDPKTQTGFYLMHSTPKYPAIDNNKVNPKIPKTGLIYGQNYMCITIGANGLAAVLSSLSVSQPNVYYDNGKLTPKTANQNSIINAIPIRMNGQRIEHISKSPSYQEYLYSTIIGPHFGVNLAVESWSHPVEPPLCTGKYTCVNVNQVKYNNQITWNVGQDHSKWAVSVGSQRRVACFGDINRAASQKKRGGGALCFDGNSNLYYALSNFIVQKDQCKNTNMRGTANVKRPTVSTHNTHTTHTNTGRGRFVDFIENFVDAIGQN
mgnify:FL=1